MTCFWDGIIQSLNNDEKNILNLKDNNIYSLIEILKEKNCETKNIKWQESELSNQLLKENIEFIKDYNKDSSKNGYLCSTCDPFLLLLCFLLNTDIIHNYNGNVINYKCEKSLKKKYFKSNKSHFWFEKSN
tara:strand:+ start:35 stop:427 length:393 start_codon:yes stop_codon:yes gene_type:complete